MTTALPASMTTNAHRSAGVPTLVTSTIRVLAALLYLLVAFPISLLAVVALTTGLCLGLGLTITLVGIPVVALTLLAARGIARLDLWLGAVVLDEPRPTAVFDLRAGRTGLLATIWGNLTSAAGWRAVVHQAIRFAVSLATFTTVVTVLSIGLGFLLAPAWYATGHLALGDHVIDSLPEALAVVPIGLVVLGTAVVALPPLARLQHRVGRLICGPNA